MKKILFTFTFILTSMLTGYTQNTKYFEFKTTCGHGNWQDTTFIASATNTILIDTVLANLARPINQRKFINGSIDYGNGGHNHNASHWFFWHFIPDQWDLVEIAGEVCDGCPYTDVDADTAYWIGNIGQFCPWSGIPVREVSDPALGIEENIWHKEVIIYPNPAKNTINVNWNSSVRIFITIYSSLGQEYSTLTFSNQNETLDLNDLNQGLYFLKVTDLKNTCIKKLVIKDK